MCVDVSKIPFILFKTNRIGEAFWETGHLHLEDQEWKLYQVD